MKSTYIMPKKTKKISTIIDDKSYFVGIGPGKTGTTWLDKYLREHDQVWLPHVKELHYFDQNIIIKSNMDTFYEKKRVEQFKNKLQMVLDSIIKYTPEVKSNFRWMARFVL